MSQPIDWDKAGKRIRHQPKAADGRNPDWDWVNQRWKDEADYYGEELSAGQIVEMVDCPLCERTIGQCCHTARGEPMTPHRQRQRAAGEIMADLHGPRFTKERTAN